MEEQKRVLRKRNESLMADSMDVKIFSGTGFVLFATTVSTISCTNTSCFRHVSEYNIRETPLLIAASH